MGIRPEFAEHLEKNGFSMPPEWGPHAGCLVSWPCKEDTWCGYFGEAKKAYSDTVRAISQFEPVIVLSDPSTVKEAQERVGESAHILEVPLDDAWIRDNGPIFVTSQNEDTSIVHFGFNGWGGRFPPFDRDAKVPEVLSEMMGLRRYVAPMVLEGGAICVDGEGTLLTTESCLLNPNRNPGLSRKDIEDVLTSYLGVRKVLWLKQGIYKSMIDGHIDGVAAFVRPSTVVLASTDDEHDPNCEVMRTNKALLETMTDARGRSMEIVDFPMPRRRDVDGNRIAPCYTNFYVAKGGVVAPTFGDENDKVALDILRGLFPDYEVVGVRSEFIGVGGGEIHCITQQVPKAADCALGLILGQ
ncbi:MAG: agmatine deiminase family protein [Candidatus Thermoplasmatota archaeon]|nr:agmatine deiminase family protein [Candidatus Thermoplasmatota archaeon]